MEVVRRDWTALAKQVQRELFERLFSDQPVDAYLAEVVKKYVRANWTSYSSIAKTCVKTQTITPRQRRRTSWPLANRRRARDASLLT
jgi:DNA polymerase elongation subunit (family B)